MNQVFLDTVGMIAVWDDTDQWHAAARAAFQALLAQGRCLLTTSFVLCECGNAAARRPYRADVNELRRFLIQEQLLVDPTPAGSRGGLDGLRAWRSRRSRNRRSSLIPGDAPAWLDRGVHE